MSLRDLGVFGALASDHPCANELCWKCEKKLFPGVRVALNPIETPDETGSLTVEAKPVCATCYLICSIQKHNTVSGIRVST